MLSDSFIPTNPADEDWDVVVVGTGMGGSTLGFELARRGHRVLFVEKGLYLYGDHDRGDGTKACTDEEPERRLRYGRWPLRLEGRTKDEEEVNEMSFFAPLGCGTGGSTSVYAAQLERFAPPDFEPRRHFEDVSDSTVPEEWPVAYEDLVEHYREAERLYRVVGTPDPLYPDSEAALGEPPPLSPRDADLFESFKRLGLHPYRSHVGFRYLDGCKQCGGTLCPRRCKSDAGSICLLPALEEHGASLLPECEAFELQADAKGVTGVRCRRGEQEFTLRPRIVVLAAGAYLTPILLLNSRSAAWPDGLANGSGLVGRNLMLHAGDFIAVRSRQQLSPDGPSKSIVVNDFYQHDGTKLGTLQSVGFTINYGYVLYFLRNALDQHPSKWLKVFKPLLRIVALAGALYYRNSAVFASIVEDLPYHENRVFPDDSSPNGMRFEYDIPQELIRRNQTLRDAMRERLGRDHRMVVLSPDKTLNFGHPCGTCRFGDDPAASVLDRDNRAHGVENLYVVDASFFPSSGGTNPSLTIAANALRVARAISAQLLDAKP